MTGEIWRDIDGYDGKYQVSNFGRVKSFKRKKPHVLIPKNHPKGYLYIGLCKHSKITSCKVHRLVAEAFVPNPDNKPQVNHINGIKTDNRAENLEWCTNDENARHAAQSGLRKGMFSGDKSPRALLNNEQAMYVRDNPDGLSIKEFAKKFAVTETTISYIQRGKTYRNAGGNARATIPRGSMLRTADNIRRQIKDLYRWRSTEFGSIALAKKFGVSHRTILNIVNEQE